MDVLDGDVAEQAANEVEGDTAVFAGDLTADGAPEALVQAAVDAFAQIDIVVNNAGYSWDGMAHKMNDDQFRAMLEIHTVVPFKVLRAAAPYLREAGKADKAAGREVQAGRRRDSARNPREDAAGDADAHPARPPRNPRRRRRSDLLSLHAVV